MVEPIRESVHRAVRIPSRRWLGGLIAGVLWVSSNCIAQTATELNIEDLRLHNAEVRSVEFRGKDALEVMISAESRAQLAEQRRRRQAAGLEGPPPDRIDHLVIVGDGFDDGTIELELTGEPAAGSEGGARGFVGVAFRLQDDLSTYECFYLRPTNGRAEDQERRNHSAQYVSHPEYSWERLRRETPSRYEAYVDLVPGEWTRIRIEVQGDKARLFVHGSDQPTLIVNDLKMGSDASGSVALWIEGSTIAHFRNLKITHQGSRRSASLR